MARLEQPIAARRFRPSSSVGRAPEKGSPSRTEGEDESRRPTAYNWAVALESVYRLSTFLGLGPGAYP